MPRPQGYLPQDQPPMPALISLAFQHVLTMFPATVLVAILTKFDVGVTLFASGLATVIAILGSGGRIPMYYGSSFSYIAPVIAIATNAAAGPRVAQAGIVLTGIVNILAGLIIRRVGKDALDRVLPPSITGSIAIVIGIALAKTALDMAGANWTVALITLLAVILFSVYLQGRGLWGMLPVLLGALVGYVVSLVLGIVDFKPVADASWLAMPNFRFPDFTHPMLWNAVLGIAPIAIATIPESTAHLYQISLYVDRLADDMGREKPTVKKLIGLNLVLDGIGDMTNGLLGGCAGTNYGENNSLMAISRNYSAPVLIGAGVIAMVLAFVGKLSAAVSTLPVAVTGGLAIFLFGVIGVQGIALMQSEKVNLFDPRQLAISSVILVVGIGGSMFEDSVLPMFGYKLPAIATSAVVGILLNVVFLVFKAPAAAAADHAAD